MSIVLEVFVLFIYPFQHITLLPSLPTSLSLSLSLSLPPPSPSPLSQGTKAIMKDVAKYLPGIGWMFLFMEYPILKRKWEDDEQRLAESCKVLSDYPVNMLVSIT